MAKVPVSQQVSQTGRVRDPGVPVRQRADITSLALAHAAAVGARIAGQLRNNRQRAEDAAFENQVTTAATERFETLFLEEQNQATDGAEDFTEKFKNKLRAESDRLLEDARKQGGRPSQRGLSRAQQILQSKQTAFAVRASIFENNARIEKFSRELEAASDAAALRAFDDPAQLSVILNDLEVSHQRAKTFLPPGKAEERLSNERAAATDAAIRGLIAQDPELAKEMLEAGDFNEDITADTKAVRLGQAKDAIKRLEAEDDRLLRARTTKAVEEARDAASVLTLGLTPPDLDLLRNELVALGNDRSAEALEDIAQAEEDGRELRDFTLSPINEQIDQMRSLQTQDKISAREVKLLGRMERAHGALLTGLSEAPYDTAAAYGIIDAPVEIDFANTDTMRARRDQATLIGSTYGVAIDPLTKSDVRSLEETFDEVTPTQAAALLATLNEGFGTDQVERMAGQFAKSRPHIAMALFYAPKNLPFSAEIIDGARVLRGNKDLRPTPTQIEAPFAEVYGDLFEFMPEMRAPFREAGVALFAGRSVGETGFDSDILKQAFQDVGGNPETFRGRVTLPPNPGGSVDDLERILQGATLEDYVEFGNVLPGGAPMDSQGRAYTADDFRQHGQFVSLGFGTYAILFEGDGFVTRSDARPGQAIFMFDAAEMLESGRPLPIVSIPDRSAEEQIEFEQSQQFGGETFGLLQGQN